MTKTLSPDTRQAIVQDVIKLARDKYVFPDAGEHIANHIQTKLERGGYEHINEPIELASALTSDLRDVSKDLHWRVMYDPQLAKAAPADAGAQFDEEKSKQEDKIRHLNRARKKNFGFEKIERLNGNIGYIDMRQFASAEYAGETAVAAMNFVSNCDALIFDMRRNHGGNPSMIQLILSYLFDTEPKHINTFYYRPTDETQQFWTFPHVPGKRMSEVPVYVLTSMDTGSAAEEFVYNLKHMGRATIVGEITLGAAHPVNLEIVQGQYKVLLPYGRAINPITGKNWEGAGVKPHIATPQEEALQKAHLIALENIIEQCADDQEVRDLEWDLEITRSLYAPVPVDESTVGCYVGQYGQRSFSVEHGALTYAHEKHLSVYKLTPITDTHFRLDDVKFEFILDEQGAASAVVITYRDGRPGVTVSKSA